MKLLNYKQETIEFQKNHKDEISSLMFGRVTSFVIEYLNQLLSIALIGQKFYTKRHDIISLIIGDQNKRQFFGTVRTSEEIVNLCKELLNY